MAQPGWKIRLGREYHGSRTVQIDTFNGDGTVDHITTAIYPGHPLPDLAELKVAVKELQNAHDLAKSEAEKARDSQPQ